MNVYMYIQKNAKGYPRNVILNQFFNQDKATEKTAFININGKNNKYSQKIYYLSKKKFKELEKKNNNIIENEMFLDVSKNPKIKSSEIIGDTCLKPVKFNKSGNYKQNNRIKNVLKIPESPDLICEYIIKDYILGHTIGYIPLGMNKYVRIKKKRIFSFILIFILLVLIVIQVFILLILIQKPDILISNIKQSFFL